MLTQYDIVCDKAMVNHFGSIGFFGFLCSQLYSGFLADRFGRKPVLLGITVCSAVIGYCIAAFNGYGLNVFIIGHFTMLFFNCQAYLA